MLQAEATYISKDQQTIFITEQAANEAQELTSNQEEADTKLILHFLHALATGSSVILRSLSAETDIMVIAFSIIRTDSDRLYVDYGSGQHRKGLLLNRIGQSDIDKDAIIGFHAFTGNDYVSAFFRKGKTT